MHCHLYRVSTSLIPATPPSPHPIPFHEHNTNLTYETPPTIPILTSTIHPISTKSFHVKCRREGGASDIDITDLLFEVFLDGVWIGRCVLREQGSNVHQINERYVSGLQVSRTSIRPFKFTSNTNPSTIEILVRTGRILPVKKPARSEKGLQDVASRDGFDRPVRLAPVLQDPMLNKFEPDPRRLAPAKLENPGKEWVAGLNALGGGTVVVAQNVVQVKETKRIDWEDPKNLVLFRYRCEVQPSIPQRVGNARGMDKNMPREGEEGTAGKESKITWSDVEMQDEGATEPEDG